MTDNEKTAAIGSGGLSPLQNCNSSNSSFRSQTKDGLMKRVVALYLDGVDPDNAPQPEQIESEILSIWRNEVKIHNATVDKGDRYPVPSRLSNYMIAEILITVHRVRHILYSDDGEYTNTNIFGFYCNYGSHRGTYVTYENELNRIARLYYGELSISDLKNVFQNLSERAPKIYRCNDPNLVPVNNGIFDYRTKCLLDFSPDLVFTAKSKVNYNPQAKNIVIHNNEDGTDWDVESWVESLSDDSEIVNLLWQVMGAILRCNVRWNMSAFFMSAQGNNGKGTLCELMRGLSGKGTYVTLPLSDFGKDFMLSPLEHASTIITDENDFEYLDKVSRLKAVITCDPINVNRKHLIPITIRFNGFMVQCLNDEAPRFKDKTSSLYRRILPIPFSKCFTGTERRYIKTDYVHRSEVLEYVMFKVLHMQYDKLSEPTACRALLDDIKLSNDPVRQFAIEMLPKCKWDFLPNDFLYDLYKAWKLENNPSGSLEGNRIFNKNLRDILREIGGWRIPSTPVNPGKRMEAAEPLIIRYQLVNFYNPVYHGNDPDKIALAPVKNRARGIIRE